MKKPVKYISILILSLCFSVAVNTESFVFNGAVGFGIDTPAGRGGRVIKVINLNAEGAGSLRAALESPGPRSRVRGRASLFSRLPE